MKTNQELLDFYGVEAGKKYEVINQHGGNQFVVSPIGKNFNIIIDGDRNEPVFCFDDNTKLTFSINCLNYLDYVEIRQKPVLSYEEREYLKTVIKPFRDRIQYIYKTKIGNFYKGGEMLFFVLKNNNNFYLPEMPSNAMCRRMETNKKYTLEELGL